MKLSILLSITILFCGAAFGQDYTLQSQYPANSTKAVEFDWVTIPMIKGDTLFITNPASIHFIKLGDKVYQITVPKPFIEEVKPPEPRNIFLPFFPGTVIDSVFEIQNGGLHVPTTNYSGKVIGGNPLTIPSTSAILINNIHPL